MTMDHLIIAPLVRGLCVNAAGRGRVIVPGSEGSIPPQALKIDIASAITGDTLDKPPPGRCWMPMPPGTLNTSPRGWKRPKNSPPASSLAGEGSRRSIG